ncbi:MAG TPA: hypothetical protein VGP63_04330, partial [Planctomycetaceae bacterium]|nr:hypothetical protein [Planctomycetaceae bacterium]
MTQQTAQLIRKSHGQPSGAESSARRAVLLVVAAALLAVLGLVTPAVARAQQIPLNAPPPPTDLEANPPLIADFQFRDGMHQGSAAPDAKSATNLAITNPEEGLSREDVVPTTSQDFAVDLSTVLQLAESENPTIALGREAIREALALQLQARGMLLPSLNAGTMYHLHQGPLQQANG